MTLRTSGGNAKNGMTCSQAASHCRLIAGYCRPTSESVQASRASAGGLLGRGGVDQAQLGGHLFAVLVVDPAQRGPGQVHDAGLHQRVGPHGLDRGRQPGQAVADHDQDVGDAAGLEVVHHPQPELGALGVLDPDAEDLLLAVDVDPDGQVRGLVLHRAGVADLADDRVEEDHRLDRVQRPGLPLPDLLEDRVGDLADQVRRDLDVVDLQQMGAWISRTDMPCA